jgi:hypothetical protein
MKKILIFCLFILCSSTAGAQDDNAAINNTWPVYANDTNLTYNQIVTICDSLFTLSGYSDTLGWKKDSTVPW